MCDEYIRNKFDFILSYFPFFFFLDILVMVAGFLFWYFLFIFVLVFYLTGEAGAAGGNHFALRFVRTKEGELTYQCGLCGYLPNSTNKSIGYAKNRVCMHIRNVHSEPTNVVCPRCSKKFKNKESLRVHKIKYCRDYSALVAENAAKTPQIAGINITKP